MRLPEIRAQYPEICTLVRLLLVSPASSAEAERSFSALRRLKTWLRTTMTETRLNSVTVSQINRPWKTWCTGYHSTASWLCIKIRTTYIDAFLESFTEKSCWHFTVWCNQRQTVYCVGDRQTIDSIWFCLCHKTLQGGVQGAKGLIVEVKAVKCLP